MTTVDPADIQQRYAAYMRDVTPSSERITVQLTREEARQVSQYVPAVREQLDQLPWLVLRQGATWVLKSGTGDSLAYFDSEQAAKLAGAAVDMAKALEEVWSALEDSDGMAGRAGYIDDLIRAALAKAGRL
jgi:hypothetical protein